MNAGRPKDLEKRKRILEAAKMLFLECGYHGCSMNKIAQKADTSKLTAWAQRVRDAEDPTAEMERT